MRAQKIAHRWLSVGVFVAAIVGTTAAHADVTVNILHPRFNWQVDTRMDVVVQVSSTYQLQSVQAQTEGRVLGLSYNASTQYWSAVMDTSGLSFGPHVLSVTAVSVLPEQGHSERVFIHDQAPRIAVQQPLDWHLFRSGQVPIFAQCTDDDPQGCLGLSVHISDTTNPALASGVQSLSQALDLSQYQGQEVSVKFQALDSSGSRSIAERRIYIENSDKLFEKELVDGKILNVQGSWLLYWTRDGQFALRNCAEPAEPDRMLGVPQPGTLAYGYAYEQGAVVVFSPAGQGAHLFQWSEQGWESLGIIDSVQSLVVRGGYALWNVGSSLWRRDLASHHTEQIASQTGNWFNDVTAQGNVAYWGYDTNGRTNIFLYRQGVSQQVTFDSGPNPRVYVRYDGINAIYKTLANAIMLYDGTSERQLVSPFSEDIYAGPYYQVSQGWAAYVRTLGGAKQVIRRSPSGQEQQLTIWGTDSFLDSINGQQVFALNAGRRYDVSDYPASAPLALSGAIGATYWTDDGAEIAIGDTLFTLTQAAADAGLDAPEESSVLDAAEEPVSDSAVQEDAPDGESDSALAETGTESGLLDAPLDAAEDSSPLEDAEASVMDSPSLPDSSAEDSAFLPDSSDGDSGWMAEAGPEAGPNPGSGGGDDSGGCQLGGPARNGAGLWAIALALGLFGRRKRAGSQGAFEKGREITRR